jgi:hypothetical protein
MANVRVGRRQEKDEGWEVCEDQLKRTNTLRKKKKIASNLEAMLEDEKDGIRSAEAP